MASGDSISWYAAEAWSWYGVAELFICFRLVSQYRLRRSIKRLYLDDWLTLLIACTYTVVIAGLHVIEVWYLKLASIPDGSPEAAKGAYMVGVLAVMVETHMNITLYAIKACLLLLYHRLSLHHKQNVAVKVVAVYAAIGFVVTIICFYSAFCKPFSGYYAAHPTNIQCVTWEKYSILQMAFNTSSDFMILIIPLSLIWRIQMQPLKKFGLCVVFAIGIMVIISAIVTKVFVFINPGGDEWVKWYVREASTAVIVSNFALCRPLLQAIFEMFWGTVRTVTTTLQSDRPLRTQDEGEAIESSTEKGSV